MDAFYRLRYLGYAEIGNSIWFANIYFNALVKVNKLTGKIEYMEKFPEHDIYESWLYSTVYSMDGYLIFIPNNSDRIVAYNVEQQEFVSTALDHKHIGEKNTYFVNAYVHKYYVYMFPTGAECIVRYDVRHNTVKYLENDLSALIRTMPDTSYWFYQQFAEVDEKLYLPLLGINAVAVFDIRDESVEIRYLDIEGGCSTINYIGKFFYLSSWKKPEIYRWNPATGEIKTYRGFPNGFDGEHMFINSYNVENTIIYFPETCNMVISFQTETGKIALEKRISGSKEELLATFFCISKDNKNYILTKDIDGIDSFDYRRNRFITEPYFRMDSSYNQKQIKNYFFYDKCLNIVGEEEGNLTEYLELFQDGKSKLKKNNVCDYGKTIFKQISEEWKDN